MFSITFLSVITFCFFISLVILFQLCLAAGLPWGSASMGGKFPGKYPPIMRVVALVNILILIFITLIVLIRTELIFPQYFSFSKIGIWFVIIFLGIGTLMNITTPSKIERIWAPVSTILFVTTLIIAL
jgi:hypothetical protein